MCPKIDKCKWFNELGGWRGIILGLLVGLGMMPLAWATQPGACTLIVESTTQTSSFTTEPTRVCSVQFFATAANGWAQVYDPAPTLRTLAEPGAATAFNNGQMVSFGEQGIVTEFGLAWAVVGGRVIIRYGQ